MSTQPASELRFAVIHLGARLHYMAPAAIAAAGALHRLYTDFCVMPGEEKYIQKLPLKLLPRALRRLVGRRIPSVISPEQVRRFCFSTFRDQYYFKRYPHDIKNAEAWFRRHMGGHYLSDRLVERDFDGANAIYVHPCVSTRAIEEAHRRGMTVVFESISHPRDQFIEAAEYERFGRKAPFDTGLMELNLNWFLKEAAQSTIVLAASEYSKTGLLEAGIPEGRIRVVPYGLPPKFFDQPPNPIKGRVLFVGTVGYRKGLPDLAAAARLLRKSHPNIEIRAAGPFEFDIAGHPEFEGPKYLGQVPRDEVKKEFLAADLFVFPTISDAFGIVLMEALAAGLPIVASTNCADAVEDGRNGYRVPVRDPETLAERIVRIVEDRNLRSAMSQASLHLVSKFSPDSYRDRMAAVMAELGTSSCGKLCLNSAPIPG